MVAMLVEQWIGYGLVTLFVLVVSWDIGAGVAHRREHRPHHVRVTNVDPSKDLVVVKSTTRITHEQAAAIRQNWQRDIETGQSIVLAPTLEIEVLRGVRQSVAHVQPSAEDGGKPSKGKGS